MVQDGLTSSDWQSALSSQSYPMRNGGSTPMQIQIWHTPAVTRSTVFIHAWDLNGGVWDLAGTLAADGVTWGFALSGTTKDQRDVSFKYRFANNVWESDNFIRTVPSLEATELWTEDYSARCATQA